MNVTPMIRRTVDGLIVLVLACTFAGCASQSKTQGHTDSASAPRFTAGSTNAPPLLDFPRPSLSHTLTEIASDGRFAVPSNNSPVVVDAHSVLHLEFPYFAKFNGTNSPDPKWQPAMSLLQFFQTTATRMNEINSRKINPQNPEEVKRLHQDAAAVAGSAADLVRQLLGNKSLGLNTSDVSDIVLGEHPSQLGFTRSTNGYVNLGHWLSVELQNRRDEFQTLVTNQQVKVRVQAVRESNGSKSALHVDGWDTFAEGAYQPIDKTGLRPTEAEQERLNTERQQAEGAKKLYESLMAKDSALKQSLKAKLKEIEDKLSQFANQMNSPADWTAEQFGALTNRLTSLAAGDSQSPAGRLLVEIRNVQADINQARALVESIRDLFNAVRGLNRLSLDELMFAGPTLFEQATSTFHSLTNFAAKVPSLPGRIQTIQENLPIVTDALVQEQTRNALRSATNFLGSLSRDFPDEARYVASLWSAAFGSFRVVQGADAIKKPEGDWTPRTLDNLVPGRLDLKRSGIALGDIVSLRVGGTNEATGEEIENVLYETEIGLIGLHGKPTVHFILARALSGPSSATQWKPNVAAAVEWHYTIREPKTGWGKAWNWFYPGAGIHLASLDQGSDSVEMGAGGIVSIWDGLLAGGYGYNFSDNPDHQYVFVGINLLTVLDESKKGFGVK